MKKIILLLLAAMLPLGAGAQKMSFREFAEKYSGRAGYTRIEVTQAMLNLMGAGQKDDKQEGMLAGIKGVTRICIITADKASDTFVGDMMGVVAEGSGYRLLTTITEGKQAALFYYKEIADKEKQDDPPRISEFIMILHGDGDNLIMSIHGDFSIKQISSIADKATSGEEINISF